MTFSLYGPFVFGHLHCNLQNDISPPVDDDVCFALHRKYQLRRSVLAQSLDPMEVCGVDSEGKEFNSAQEMWREEIGEEGDETKKTQWYRDGVSYWEVSYISFVSVLGLEW